MIKDSKKFDEVWVGFDIDEVLANLREGLSRQMSIRLGGNFDWRHWNDYSFFLPHMSKQDFYEMIMDDRLLETCHPEPHAAETIFSLREQGLKVALITARGFHPKAQEITSDWLIQNGIEVDLLHIVPAGEGKADVLLGLPNIIAYVDDHLGHLDDVFNTVNERKLTSQPLLCVMDQPWNQVNDLGHRRVRSNREFHDIVFEEIEINKAKDAKYFNDSYRILI